MKDIKDVLIVTQARLSSQRVPYKMLRPLGKTNLFELILTKLKASDYIPDSNIYASVYEQELKQQANEVGIKTFMRSSSSATTEGDIKELYSWWDKLPFKYVVLVSGCSPFLKISTIDKFVKAYIEQEEDNLFAVTEKKQYFFNSKGKLITPWPEGFKIMNTKFVEPTYEAAHVLYASRMDLIGKEEFMGDMSKGEVKLFTISEQEAFDIDYEWQFELASDYLRNNL
jgi:CMP-N-acetylneuraminic acid synthetase